MIDVYMQDLALSKGSIHDRQRKELRRPLKHGYRHVLTIGDQQVAMALHSYQENSRKVNRRPFPLLRWIRKSQKQVAQY